MPEGFAHGFQALEMGTRVHYKVTNYWHQLSERSLNYADPELNIKWHNLHPIVSDKDRMAANFAEIIQ